MNSVFTVDTPAGNALNSRYVAALVSNALRFNST